jgi:ankyrin repeat protein
LDAVVHLVTSGQSVHDEDSAKVTPLYYASRNGRRDVCGFLLQNESDVNHQGGYYGNALQAAASGGHEAVLKILLEKDADINVQDGKYGSALQVAASGGYGGGEDAVGEWGGY